MMEFLSKVTILHCTECNSTKKRLRYRFFLECLERFNKDVTLQYTAAKKLKNATDFRPFCRSTENSDVFTGKRPWWSLFFSNVVGLEFTSAT